ncbi:hypothetical protein FQZ97_911770 [compost metagenome]
MTLAVATTKTGALRSAIQVNKVPSTRWLTPPSWSPLAKPFSISSIHSTQGAICSASFKASRRLRSVSPKNLLYRQAKSRRSKGKPHNPATAFAARLLPPPCTPTSNTPLGRSTPLPSRKTPWRSASQRFRLLNPPTSAKRAVSYSKLSTPSRSSNWNLVLFSSGKSSWVIAPSSQITLRARARASAWLMPRRFFTTCCKVRLSVRTRVLRLRSLQRLASSRTIASNSSSAGSARLKRAA